MSTEAGNAQSKVEATLGVGIAFPFHFDDRGRVARSSGVTHVKEAIIQTLTTSFSERVMVRRFGSSIRDYLFEVDLQFLQQQVRSDIESTVKRWEKRVRLVNVRVERDENEPSKINVSVSYIVVRTNEAGVVVWPFYLRGD